MEFAAVLVELILDENLETRFHNLMETGELSLLPVHGGRNNLCQAEYAR